MKFYLTLFIIFIIISCSSNEDQLSTEEIVKEKEAIIETLKSYNKAYEKKNFPAMVEYLANDLTFFGSDSAETIKSLTEFKEAIQRQWEETDSMRYGEMTDIYILLDSKGKIASVLYGIPLDLWTNGNYIHIFLRVARTLKKEGGKWVIVSGITGITVASKSPKELLPKKQEPGS